mmetsp:Transcript_31951/g.93955  ORF Transcript_31951/g.93955 Transcript_31951/m.93955 type:complete len:315 (-) Transcript_31951:1345-2289(-)
MDITDIKLFRHETCGVVWHALRELLHPLTYGVLRLCDRKGDSGEGIFHDFDPLLRYIWARLRLHRDIRRRVEVGLVIVGSRILDNLGCFLQRPLELLVLLLKRTLSLLPSLSIASLHLYLLLLAVNDCAEHFEGLLPVVDILLHTGNQCHLFIIRRSKLIKVAFKLCLLLLTDNFFRRYLGRLSIESCSEHAQSASHRNFQLLRLTELLLQRLNLDLIRRRCRHRPDGRIFNEGIAKELVLWTIAINFTGIDASRYLAEDFIDRFVRTTMGHHLVGVLIAHAFATGCLHDKPAVLTLECSDRRRISLRLLHQPL